MSFSETIRTKRFRSNALQIAFVMALTALIGWLFANAASNLESRGIAGGFAFLDRAARFPVSESVLVYKPTDTFAWAFAVGIANTLYITLIVSFLATIIGVWVGLARTSTRPILRRGSAAYVDFMRNTPLIVQLLFWYAAITVGLPTVQAAFSPVSNVFVSNRGINLPAIVANGSILPFAIVSVCVLASLTWAAAPKLHVLSSERFLRWRFVPAALLLPLLGWAFLSAGFSVVKPTLGRFNYGGGLAMSPEFISIVFGLTLYSIAFIAEIARAGISSVSTGQWEAARSLGLKESDVRGMIVMPQALRLMIPPMTNQYISILKNSTLAMVVGYPDILFVAATTINQTGQAIEGTIIIMLIFLSVSVSASFALNLYSNYLGRAGK